MGTADIVENKKIYQNDFYGATTRLTMNPAGDVGIANVFSKESKEEEYIEELQTAVSGNVKIEVYINPSDASLDKSKLQKVEVDKTTLDATYNTLKPKNPGAYICICIWICISFRVCYCF